MQEGLEWLKTIFRKRHTDSIGFNSISYPKIHNLARKCTKRHRIDSKGFISLYLQTNIAGKEVIVKNSRVFDKKQIQGGMKKTSALNVALFMILLGASIHDEIKSMHIYSMSQWNGPLINMDCMVKINFTWYRSFEK